jgi:glycosyltransferase involved in cell wall biosynthesis
MKIGIDARSILNPEKTPEIGVGHYTYQIIKNLIEADKKNEYVLFFDYRVREKDVKKFSRKNVKIHYFPWSDYKKYLPGAYSEILGLATLGKDKLDVLHTASPDARVPLGYKGKVVCTFQDMGVYNQPDLFPKYKKVKARYNRQAMAKRADKIIAVSENTKDDLKKFLGVNEEKVAVIKNGVDKRFFEKNKNKINLEDKFGIKKDYILFVGTIEPSKNITRLMQAFRLLKDKFKKEGNEKDYQLIIGGKRGWLADKYGQIAKDLGVGEDIKFLGYVEGEDLKALFSQTSLFVMPSLYEGFGMTVLEAMASKAPCLVSDLKSLREIAEGGAEFIDPYDANGLAIKMEDLLKNQNKKEKMIAEGHKIAEKFSWDNCVKETLKIYESFGKNK